MVAWTIDHEKWRVRLALLGMLAALLFLGVMLWRIQVAQGQEYARDELRQSVRRVRMPGMRGRIFDAAGRVMADNRPSYNVAIYLEEIRQPGGWDETLNHVEALLDELAAALQVERQLTRDDIWQHVRRRLPMPLLAWRDIDEQTLARWAEQVAGLPGVDIYTEAVRVYPQGDQAAHLLGYVGRADPLTNEAEPYHYYLPEMEGRAGLERTHDADMRAAAGARLVRVDAVGYRHEDLASREAGAGHDIQLTIDLRVQRIVEEALGDNPGAAVVLDPNSGDVLAMVSVPTYDPNLFVPAISHSDWAVLRDDPQHPMLNRATAGAFAPGSIFKPIVAIAALENQLAGPEAAYNCPGHFELGGRRFHCWHRPGHGLLDMRQSLERSCNVYYFRLGLQIGYDPIYHMAAALGLGQKTGIAVDHEVAGNLPNDAWKRRVYNDAWRDGDTVNVSIGQGPITVTPLQMARYIAAVANGGMLYAPRLVKAVRPAGEEAFTPIPAPPPKPMNWSATTMAVVRGGMLDVVYGAQGTARNAAVPGLRYGGKTGSAEFGPKEDETVHAWMVAFAPFDQPRYALALMTDEGVSGGTTAGPKVRQIFEQLLGGGL
jgi:penicillin-binding protein 2